MKVENEQLRLAVKSLKDNYGITYSAINKKLGFGASTIYRWMNGCFDLKAENIEKIKNYINSIARME